MDQIEHGKSRERICLRGGWLLVRSKFLTYFATPSCQASDIQAYVKSIGDLGKGKYNPGGRAYPDLVALGQNIPLIIRKEDEIVSGTSASAPIVAGHIALLNNHRQRHDKGKVGWFHPKLYANSSALTDLASGKTGGCFEDETTSLPCCPRMESCISGLGYPNFKAWQALN